MKATGRWPANARPMAVPMIVDSDNAEFFTRPGKLGTQPPGDAEHVPLGVLDVLAEQHDAGIHRQAIPEHGSASHPA